MVNNSLFDLTSIHQRYWKDFCDVCYSRFGFEQGEERTYEQKYETFCRCRGIVTEDENYKNDLLYVKESDLQHFVNFATAYFDEKDAELRAMQLATMDCWLKKLEERLRKDYELTRFISPRSPLVDYAKYKLPGKLQIIWNHDNRDNRKLKELNDTITSTLICHLQACYEDNEGVQDAFKRMEMGEPVWGVLHIFASYLVDDYNNMIDAVESATSLEDYHSKEDELNAFIYRLFMSYGQSIREIKDLVEEYPSPRNLEVLKTEFEHLIEGFEKSRLGEHWMECIKEKDGLQHIAKFFMNKRKLISEEEEYAFFYTLDKICIINDILKGNAEKYWLELVYPEGWIKEDEPSTLEQLSEDRQMIVTKLLRLVSKGDWVEPATEKGIKDFILNVLGIGPISLTADDRLCVPSMWKLLESGSGNRVTIVFQNLIGYFVSRGWLPKGSPALNKKFFGTADNYTNIDKGNPNGTDMSKGFKDVLPLLDKCAKAIES